MLVRSSAAYAKLVEQFATFDIPVQPGGRIGLFEQREAIVLGKTIVWLTGLDWREGWERGIPVTDDGLLDEYAEVFSLDRIGRARIGRFLREWRAFVARDDRRADLVGEL